MLTLPSPHQAYLKAFWVIISTIAGGSLMGIFWMLGNMWGVISGFGLGAVALAFGLFESNMRVMWIAYKVWNKLAEWIASVLQTVILAITFFILFLLVGKGGSFLQLEKPKGAQSRWIQRGTMPRNAYESQSSLERSSPSGSHWGKVFADWAGKTGKHWAWFLLPFLYLLSFLDTQSTEEEVPAGIYSLF